MSLQIIFGRSGSGKSTMLMDRIEDYMQENKACSIFLIVPEQFTYSAERELVRRLGVTSPRTVEVLSFKRLAHYAANLAGGSTYPRLTPAGKWILLRRIADSLKGNFSVLGKLARQNGFCDVASNIISEFKRYNITPNILEKTCEKLPDNQPLKQKMTDISAVYSAFENAISSKYLNADDELTLLAKLIENHNLFSGDAFFFDGFAGFTPQEFEVIKVLLPRNTQTTMALCTNSLEQNEIKLTDMFAQQKRTAQMLNKTAKEFGVEISPPINLTESMRFKDTTDLAHLEKNLAQYSLSPYQNIPQNVRVLIADTRYGEIEQIACEISHLVRDKGVRYKNIAVTARSLGDYEQLIEAVFAKYEIPYFMDKKSGVTEHPAAFSVLAAMDIYIKKWNYETVFSYIKSGFATDELYKMDLLENYILATGIRGTTWTNEKDWQYTPNALFATYKQEEKAEYIAQLNAIRRELVSPLEKLHSRLKASENTREMCIAVFDFMTSIGMGERIKALADRFLTEGLGDLAAQYHQIWNIIIATLDEINTVAGEDKLNISEFRSLFCAALEAHDIGIIPSLSDCVTIGSAERSRGSGVEYSFVIGLNDGAFPMVNSTEGILSDNDRNELNSLGLTLAPDTVQQAFDELYIAYTALTQPKNRLYASYPVSDSGGSALRPSILVYRLKRLFPQLKETDLTLRNKIGGLELVNSPVSTFEYAVKSMRLKRDNENVPDLWQNVCSWYENNVYWKEKYNFALNALEYKPEPVKITDELMKKLMTTEDDGTLITSSSVSRLEQYIRCPFSHFSNYMLKAKPRAISALQSVDLGSFAHKVMEELSTAVQDSGMGWQGVNEAWIRERLAKICDRLGEELLKQFGDRSARKMALLARLKRMSAQAALMLALHLKRGEFIPLGYEIEFGTGKKYAPITIDLGMRKKIRLRGKIDRADIYIDPNDKKYIRVIDYKTGNKTFNISELYFGLEVQLAVYLDAISTAENATPSGMLYFRLFDPVVEKPPETSQEEIDGEVLKQYKMNGLLLAERTIIEKMDTHAGEANSILPVKYNSDGSFSATSSIAGREQLAAMQIRLREVLKDTAKELTGGNANVNPIKYANKTACEYCDYFDVCHFDLSVGCKYNIIQPLKAAEAWDKIVEEGAKDNAKMD